MLRRHLSFLCASGVAALAGCADRAALAPTESAATASLERASTSVALPVSLRHRPRVLAVPRGGFGAIAFRVNDKGFIAGSTGYEYVGPSPHAPGTVTCRVAYGAAIWRDDKVLMLHEKIVQALKLDPCQTSTRAVDINNDGAVVGDVRDQIGGTASYGFAWVEGMGVIAIRDVGDTFMAGINNRGLAVGYSYTQGGTSGGHVFGWTRSGGSFEIPGPPQPVYNWETATDVSDGGDVLGCSDHQVARWSARSQGSALTAYCRPMAELAPGQFDEYWPGGLNASGDAAFLSWGPDGGMRGFWWGHDAAAPRFAAWRPGGATALSDLARMVGVLRVSDSREWLAVTQRDDDVGVLASPYDAGASVALGVNACGDAVGWARSARGTQSAVMWTNSSCDAPRR